MEWYDWNVPILIVELHLFKSVILLFFFVLNVLRKVIRLIEST